MFAFPEGSEKDTLLRIYELSLKIWFEILKPSVYI